MIEFGSDTAEGGIKDAAGAEMTLEDDRHGHCVQPDHIRR
jgi:hypothetical protein